MEKPALVRAAFRSQADYCERLGSPFTARLCLALADLIDKATPLGARTLNWPGDPDPIADGLPLRLCGGLHAAVRSGAAPELARLYPPNSSLDEGELRSALAGALRDYSDALLPWLDNAPQTNEVGRSAVLMAGLLVAAQRFPLPIRLFELGASAGLNMNLDRYGYDLGGLRTGAAESLLQLAPAWEGGPPPDAEVRILGRAGVDLAPMDLPSDAGRLLAYVWPDQAHRLRQLGAALEIATLHPPAVAAGDAGPWLERELEQRPEQGVLRLVMHSVAFNYFPGGTQDRIVRHLESAGAEAPTEAPLAWLRFEKRPEDEVFTLRLRTWPGDDELLASADPHGRSVRWLLERPTASGPARP